MEFDIRCSLDSLELKINNFSLDRWVGKARTDLVSGYSCLQKTHSTQPHTIESTPLSTNVDQSKRHVFNMLNPGIYIHRNFKTFCSNATMVALLGYEPLDELTPYEHVSAIYTEESRPFVQMRVRS